VGGVVFGDELVESAGLFGREDLGFGVDGGFEWGGDAARLSLGGDRAGGTLSVAAGGRPVGIRKTSKMKNAGPEACATRNNVAGERGGEARGIFYVVRGNMGNIKFKVLN